MLMLIMDNYSYSLVNIFRLMIYKKKILWTVYKWNILGELFSGILANNMQSKPSEIIL